MALVLSAFVGVVYNRRCLLRGCVCLRLPSSSTPRDSVIPKCSIDVAASDRRPKRLLERAFFRAKNLQATFVFSMGYSVIVIGCWYCLSRFDHLAAFVFGFYLIYLIYANVLGYRLWRLNSGAR